ncbi:hypothetical protein M5J20_02905 [Corynebacterium sp. TA-R-1]|uniref:Carbamoyl-phosphate synthase small subunit N-terminal domain-containing protein n=1 Tax=Corynebacterium stercoris TaxID=2943490 RepID=A0ABT1FZW6_9CORY|nr:carbamoyl-phosphate synthase domain-containing protein [Corynebacterium stercoris]MCP1387142.1 hypothetical protein [Corynebacterium stercoris]
MTTSRIPAVLVLADGTRFPGFAFGAAEAGASAESLEGTCTHTVDMFGYQREMTSPERKGEILVFAAPQVGNVGWNSEDSAGDGSITPAAVVVRDVSRIPSNFRAQRTLEEELRNQGVTGIRGVDTRKLVRHLSKTGPQQATIQIQEAK